MSEHPEQPRYVPVHHVGTAAGPRPEPVPVHHAGTSHREYRSAPVTVVSSPVVDAAVIAGRARGYADGLAAAQEQATEDRIRRDAEHRLVLEQMRAEHRAGMEALDRAAGELAGVQATTLEQARAHILQASVSVAATILGAELTDASVAARGAIARALSAPVPSPVHTVRMNPDAALAARQAGAPAHVEIVSDPSLPPGGAVAEYEDGWLDAGIEAALQRVSDTVLHEELAAL